MFNLLVSTNPWTEHRAVYYVGRVLQPGYTDDALRSTFAPNGSLDFVSLMRLPALFVEETYRHGPVQLAKVGHIISARMHESEVIIEYVIDQRFRPITQTALISIEGQLGIISNPRRGFGELSTTHWAVKDYDLFKALLMAPPARLRIPTAFTLPDLSLIHI